MKLDNLIENFETRIFLGIFLLTLFLYQLYSKLNKKRYNIPPGPTGLPIVGYLPFLSNYTHITFHELSEKYGKVFSVYVGQTLCIICSDWTSSEEALNKMEFLDKLEGIFDDVPNTFGFTGTNGKKWLDQRRIAVKTMRNIGLGRPQWEKVIKEEVDDIIEEIRKHNGQTIDVRKILFSTFTNNMMTLMFGERLPSDHPATVCVCESVDYIVEKFKLLALPNFLPKIAFLLLKMGLYGSKNTIKKVYDYGYFMEKYIDQELAEHSNNDEVFVQMYQKEAKLNPFIPKNALYGDVQAIIFAGSETSRTAMLWLLLAMAENPQIQKTIQEELDSVLGKDGKLNWSERDKTPYTYAAELEAMRWKTIVPINNLRVASADAILQGYDVPKGTVIIVNQWSLHNDPEYWPEPHKFDPRRFITNEGKLINSPESYIPFSLGKRNCPGKNIALMEIFEYFISIMKNFTVLPPENGIQYDTIFGLTYQATNLRLRLVPRD